MSATFLVFNNATRKRDLVAVQLATLTFYVQSVQYRFVITQLPGQPPAVTHRASGSRVAVLDTLNTSLGDYVVAGKAALTSIIDKYGAARVASTLRAAELVTDRPLAAKGLTSYRYRGPYGFVMIGAKNHIDALKQAELSVDVPVVLSGLEVYTNGEYVPAYETALEVP